MPNKFHRIKKIASGRYFTKIKEGWVFKDGEFHKVWSGASEVSYYDGDTLLGTEEVDEGEDVLHPSISTTKSGYTLYGWATSKNTETRVESLLATGEPMKLYAIYFPNTLVVVSATVWFDGAGNPNYQLSNRNTKYVTGNTSLMAEKWYSTGPFESSTSFSFNKGVYQNVSCKAWTGIRDYGETYFDGAQQVKGDDASGYTYPLLANGNHTLRCYGWAHYNNSWAKCLIGITNLTLSNPIAWE